MYFWRIEKLKSALAARPLSERESLPYLVAFVVLCTAVTYIPLPVDNVWDGLGAFWSIVLAAAGTIYVYRQNGGGDGQHFLQRYFAVSWVVSIRLLAGFIPVAGLFYGTLVMVGADLESTQWYDFLFLAVAEGVIYWRIGHHIRDLSQRPTAG